MASPRGEGSGSGVVFVSSDSNGITENQAKQGSKLIADVPAAANYSATSTIGKTATPCLPLS